MSIAYSTAPGETRATRNERRRTFFLRHYPFFLPGCVLVLLCAFLFFYRLADRDLWSSHEARAGMDAQTILDDGDWLVPHLYDGQPELQKPPLYYWLVAFVARARGGPVDAWAVRLPSALAAAGCVFTLVLWGWARGRWLAGMLAGAILATALHFTWLARIGRTDMPLTLCVTLSVVAWNLASDPSRHGRFGWHLLAFLAVAAGILMKGPLALLLPLGILFCQGLLMRAAGRFHRAAHAAPLAPEAAAPLAPVLWGLPLVLALTLPWFVAANVRTDGELFRVFIWHHNIERGLGGSELRSHPWWFYGPQFLADFLPWSIPFCAALVWWGRSEKWRRDPELCCGLAWFIAVILILSCFRFKRADYLLPAYPGAAWFLGCLAERLLRQARGPSCASHHAPRTARHGIIIALLLGTVGMTLGWAWKIERALPREEASREYRTFAERVRQEAPAPAPILFFRTEAHPLAFHVGRPLAVLLEWHELHAQLGQGVPSLVVLPAAWLQETSRRLPGIQLVELARHPHVAGPPRERPLLLVRAIRKDER